MSTQTPVSPSKPSVPVNPIQNVLICGTGAVGGAYAKKIADHNPHRLRILARGDRKRRYEQGSHVPLHVRAGHGRVRAPQVTLPGT